MLMQELVRHLDDWLSHHHSTYYWQLQPGLDDITYQTFEEKLGLELPEAFYTLYRWRNGQPNNYLAGLQGNNQFLSIETILANKKILDTMLARGQFKQENWWDFKWVPFLGIGRDYLCIDLAGKFYGTSGQLISVWHDWEDRSIEYPSLEKWLEIFINSLEADLWILTNGNLEPIDEDIWEHYLLQHNPGYPVETNAG